MGSGVFNAVWPLARAVGVRRPTIRISIYQWNFSSADPALSTKVEPALECHRKSSPQARNSMLNGQGTSKRPGDTSNPLKEIWAAGLRRAPPPKHSPTKSLNHWINLNGSKHNGLSQHIQYPDISDSSCQDCRARQILLHQKATAINS